MLIRVEDSEKLKKYQKAGQPVLRIGATRTEASYLRRVNGFAYFFSPESEIGVVWYALKNLGVKHLTKLHPESPDLDAGVKETHRQVSYMIDEMKKPQQTKPFNTKYRILTDEELRTIYFSKNAKGEPRGYQISND